ncbi:hypothetical protein B7Y92_03110 [Candidatus Saccharibacteria bacterium 32-50-13]|nr:MAG: hypothetical protein B7Y92_03110 [Candidatus Saccharibacteria bacterium 32-50-13]
MIMNSKRFLTGLLIVSAVLGLVASFALTFETIQVAKDANYQPACSINPIITCSSAMNSEEASIIAGIPNSMWGIVAFTGLLAVAVLLSIGSVMSWKAWAMILGAAFGGVAFTVYLYLISLFKLGTICPWCSVIWVTVPLIYFGVVRLAAQSNRDDDLGKTWPARFEKFVAGLDSWASFALIMWYTILILGLVVIFWEYWSSLIG